MRDAFLGEEFRSEHDKEPSEKKEGNHEFAVPFPILPAALHEKENA